MVVSVALVLMALAGLVRSVVYMEREIRTEIGREIAKEKDQGKKSKNEKEPKQPKVK